MTPPNTALLLDLVAESLCLKGGWDEADMAAMRRWRAGTNLRGEVFAAVLRRRGPGADEEGAV